MRYGETPVFITCRDRLSSLLPMLSWLEQAGHNRIILVDNASTHPPLREFLERTTHTVVRLDRNLGQLAAWESGAVRKYASNEWYVVSDPDIVPTEDCPADAVAYFREVLERYPLYVKAGFGLRIDDLPACYKHARDVRSWERQFFWQPFGRNLYHASIDTTFALYRPYNDGFQFAHGPAIRTGRPYLARHLPWYTDSSNPTEEELYYAKHARADVTTWSQAALPKDFERGLVQIPRWSMRQRLNWRLYLLLGMKGSPDEDRVGRFVNGMPHPARACLRVVKRLIAGR